MQVLSTPFRLFKPMAPVFALIGLLFLVGQSHASEWISAQDAYERSRADTLILIDIRSRQEWKDTGIAETAIPLSMHERGFLEGYNKIRSENPDKAIALICATGGRTHFIQSELQKRNLGAVIDVSEGMMGNGRGKGWIALGLPIKKFE